MATQSQYNHITSSIMTKGVLGGTTGLLTKGILTDLVQIIITTKRGGGFVGSVGVDGEYYDREYWKRFKRELEENDDEIETIEVRITKKHIKRTFKITAELLTSKIEAEFIGLELIDEDDKPDIKITLVDDHEDYTVENKANISAELIESRLEDYRRAIIKANFIDITEEVHNKEIKATLIEEDDDENIENKKEE